MTDEDLLFYHVQDEFLEGADLHDAMEDVEEENRMGMDGIDEDQLRSEFVESGVVTPEEFAIQCEITELERQTVEILDENDSINTRAVSIVEKFYTFSLEFRVFQFIVTKIVRVNFLRELRHWHEIWSNIKTRDIPDGFLIDDSKRFDNDGPNVVEEFYHMAERSWTEMMKSPEQIFKINHSPDSQLGLYSLINIPVTTGPLPRQWNETLKGYLERVPIDIF